MSIPTRDGLTPDDAFKLDIVCRNLMQRGAPVVETWPERWEIDGDPYAGELLSCLIQWGDDHLSTRDDWP